MKLEAIALGAVAITDSVMMPCSAVASAKHASLGDATNVLLHSSSPKSPLPTPVEELGHPTEGFDAKNTKPACYNYRAATARSPLIMGGKERAWGFQVSTRARCHGSWTWTWHIAGLYSQGFTACVGLAGGDTEPATLSFVGPHGGLIAFRAGGRSVHQATLLARYPTDVLVTTWRVPSWVIRTTTPGATISFANDSLSPGPVPARQCG